MTVNSRLWRIVCMCVAAVLIFYLVFIFNRSEKIYYLFHFNSTWSQFKRNGRMLQICRLYNAEGEVVFTSHYKAERVARRRTFLCIPDHWTETVFQSVLCSYLKLYETLLAYSQLKNFSGSLIWMTKLCLPHFFVPHSPGLWWLVHCLLSNRIFHGTILALIFTDCACLTSFPPV
jgi:hypothetical protein